MLFAFDEFVLDTRAFALTHRGGHVSLQRKPLDLLTYLITHRDRVVTKAEILNDVWGGVRVTDNALVQAIANVRATLGSCGRAAIVSIRGRGYRFVIPVVTLDRQELAPAVVHAVADAREPLATFRAVLRAYADARPLASIEGVPFTTRLSRAESRADVVSLVLELFGDPRQAPAAIVIEQLERADLESLLLYAALSARPSGSLVLRGTCRWAGLSDESLVARLLRLGLDGVPPELAASA